MHKIVLLLLSTLPLTSAFGQSSKFTVAGDVTALKAPADWVYLSYYVNDRHITDSAPVRQNSYYFSGNLVEPVLARLRVKYKASAGIQPPLPGNNLRDYASVFLQPGAIKVVSLDSFSNVSVAGSKADDEYRMLEETARPYNEQLDELYRKLRIARKNKEADLATIFENQIDSLNASANENPFVSSNALPLSSFLKPVLAIPFCASTTTSPKTLRVCGSNTSI